MFDSVPSEVWGPTIALMVLGVVGCIIPFLPGPPLVFAGALFFAWQMDFEIVGWPSLVILGALALLGATSNLWMGYLGAKTGGASVWASVAAMVGGILGLIFFNVPGAIIGSIGSIVLVEYTRHRDWNAVWKASGGYAVGYLLSTVVEVLICFVMIGVFLVAVWL